LSVKNVVESPSPGVGRWQTDISLPPGDNSAAWLNQAGQKPEGQEGQPDQHGDVQGVNQGSKKQEDYADQHDLTGRRRSKIDRLSD
jgi:hypothetical protein